MYQYITTNEFTTAYLDSGSGAEAVVLLHGGGPGANAATNWQDFMPGLADRYRVIAPDIFGFGKTEHPSVEYLPGSMTGWMRQRVRQVLSLMDQLGFRTFHLVGNSAGGALSLWIAMTAPERVSTITLMGSAGGQMASPTPEVIRMVSFYKDASRDGIDALTRWFVYDEEALDASVADIVEERYAEVHRDEVRRSYESMYATPVSPAEMTVPPSALRRIKQRVLLVHGAQDRFITPDSSIYFGQHLENSQVHIFNQCGHWVQIEKRDQMLFLVRSFLAEQI